MRSSSARSRVASSRSSRCSVGAVFHESVDANGNKGTAERSLVIQDTLAPDMAVISHAFMANPAIALNAYHDSSKAMISAAS